MKKLTRRSFTAAGILTALGLGGVFTASSNLIGCVYGPPPEDDYDPKNNELEDVYGPPPEDDEPEDDPDEVEEVEEYDPVENELVDVYGPPIGD